MLKSLHNRAPGAASLSISPDRPLGPWDAFIAWRSVRGTLDGQVIDGCLQGYLPSAPANQLFLVYPHPEGGFHLSGFTMSNAQENDPVFSRFGEQAHAIKYAEDSLAVWLQRHAEPLLDALALRLTNPLPEAH